MRPVGWRHSERRGFALGQATADAAVRVCGRSCTGPGASDRAHLPHARPRRSERLASSLPQGAASPRRVDCRSRGKAPRIQSCRGERSPSSSSSRPAARTEVDDGAPGRAANPSRGGSHADVGCVEGDTQRRGSNPAPGKACEKLQGLRLGEPEICRDQPSLFCMRPILAHSYDEGIDQLLGTWGGRVREGGAQPVELCA